ncbi:MAG: YggS family pyridoxal phosphate-dependent enzyme [Deltaproteobacteria bacterium]|nr:YggS family pyridoxal phosphate-dependent enzyme [Deltaproteobacteria bacterium]
MIRENVKKLLEEIPQGVELEAAAKTRTAEEVLEAVKAGIKIVGENYMRDVKKVYPVIGKKAKWHFIGTPETQKHDLLKRKNLEIFDMIETINSVEIAEEIDKRCKSINKIMPVLIEVNSGREPQKSGVMPEDVESLIRKVAQLKNMKIMGLMTMGPRFGNPEDSRPYFIGTKKIFDKIERLNIPNVEMKYLSMGMTNSYQIAIEEGANIVRIGTKIFGEREK